MLVCIQIQLTSTRMLGGIVGKGGNDSKCSWILNQLVNITWCVTTCFITSGFSDSTFNNDDPKKCDRPHGYCAYIVVTCVALGGKEVV